MAEDLAAQSCAPCGGGISPLDPDAAEQLRQAVPNWSFENDSRRMERRYGFKAFEDSWRFVNAASQIAEKERHHPDIAFGWGYATVSLQTHTIKGLHRNDFVLAAKYDLLYRTLCSA